MLQPIQNHYNWIDCKKGLKRNAKKCIINDDKISFFLFRISRINSWTLKYVLKVILNIIKRWPISLRTYVHRPTINPLPYTTLFIQNISPFLIALLSRKKTVNNKDIEL